MYTHTHIYIYIYVAILWHLQVVSGTTFVNLSSSDLRRAPSAKQNIIKASAASLPNIIHFLTCIS